ncbi:MAG: hypothetical protein H0U35_05190 [Sporichthyaceae bacterium]|nr:hypothetical protein [Sporichthyaceae bacterium]
MSSARLDRLERDLRAARTSYDRVTASADAWQQNQRRLAATRGRRNRWWLGTAAALVAVALVGGAATLSGRGPASGPPAGGGDDPFSTQYLLGEPVELERVTIDGEPTVHEAALSDMTGQGPNLCDRFVSASSEAGGCTTRESTADDPKVAFDWLSGTEGGGDIRGVLAGVDSRAAAVRIWMSNGNATAARLHPGGWDGTRLFALTVPASGPRPQRLVATGRDGNVLQAVDLPARFGDQWLAPSSACAGNRVAERVPDGDVLPNAYIALGTSDARISIRAAADDTTNACLELRPTAVAGAYVAGSLAVIVLAPEVERVEITDGGTVLRELVPTRVTGSPWALVEDIDKRRSPDAEIVAYDRHGLELDREFMRQRPSP